jgi:hypothetical protein
VLPKDIDGIGLLQLSVSRLNDLFASSASNKARNQKEGKLMMMMIMIMMILMMILMMMMMMMMIHDLSKSTRLERSSICCTKEWWLM